MEEEEASQRLTECHPDPVVILRGAHLPGPDTQDPEQCMVIQVRRTHACRQHAWPLVKTAASVTAHVGMLLSIGMSAWYRHQHNYSSTRLRNDFNSYSLVSGLVSLLFYAVILLEASVCDTYRALKAYHPSQTAEEYIDTARDARPQIRWRADCYHYPCEGAKGNATRRKTDRIITTREADVFKFSKWRDLTRDIKGLFQNKIATLECSKIFIFKDESSKNVYMEQYTAFRDRNRRKDEFMEHEEEFDIPGYHDQLTASVRRLQRPWWSQETCFYVCSALLCTWPYRWFFRKNSNKVYIVFIKELEC